MSVQRVVYNFASLYTVVRTLVTVTKMKCHHATSNSKDSIMLSYMYIPKPVFEDFKHACIHTWKYYILYVRMCKHTWSIRSL